MQLFESINRAQRIHQFIRTESTGSPCEFAKRLGISRRQLYYCLEEFKDFGAQIVYNRTKNTFYYANDFEFLLTISTSSLSNHEKSHILGGNIENKSNSANLLHYNHLSLLCKNKETCKQNVFTGSL